MSYFDLTRLSKAKLWWMKEERFFNFDFR